MIPSRKSSFSILDLQPLQPARELFAYSQVKGRSGPRDMIARYKRITPQTVTSVTKITQACTRYLFSVSLIHYFMHYSTLRHRCCSWRQNTQHRCQKFLKNKLGCKHNERNKPKHVPSIVNMSDEVFFFEFMGRLS